jgi:hypothetical protein
MLVCIQKVHLDLFAARVSELLPGVARRVALVAAPQLPLPRLASKHGPALLTLAPAFTSACQRAAAAGQSRRALAAQHGAALAAARAAALAASDASAAAEVARGRLLSGGGGGAGGVSRLERLVEQCAEAQARAEAALNALFASSSSSSGDSGNLCARLEADATAAAIAAATAFPGGVFMEGCVLLESFNAGPTVSSGGKGDGSFESGGWSGGKGKGKGGSSSASVAGTVAGLPELRALCALADQQREAALDSAAAALVGAASALHVCRAGLLRAGLGPLSRGAGDRASAGPGQTAAARYVALGAHAATLQKVQPALARAGRLAARLAPTAAAEAAQGPPCLSTRAYAAERAFWAPLAAALAEGEAAAAAQTRAAAWATAALAAARDVSLLEAALRSVGPQRFESSGGSAQTAAEAAAAAATADAADLSLVAARDAAGEELGRLARIGLVPPPRSVDEWSASGAAAAAHRTREVPPLPLGFESLKVNARIAQCLSCVLASVRGCCLPGGWLGGRPCARGRSRAGRTRKPRLGRAALRRLRGPRPRRATSPPRAPQPRGRRRGGAAAAE